MTSLVAAIGNCKNSDVQADLLSGMRDALRGNRNVPSSPAWPATYAGLIKNPSHSVRADAYALALIFGDQQAAKSLKRQALDAAELVDDRREALAALVEARVPGLAEVLQMLLGDALVRTAALEGLAAYDDPRTADVILSHYSNFSSSDKRQAIETLVARPSFAAALLKAVANKQVPAADISIEAARQLHNFKNRQIDDTLAKVWGTLRESAADKKEQIQKYKNLLTAEFMKSADPTAGRAVFSQTCGKCHSLYGAGGKIGPDLTGANRSNIDYVLQKVIDPNAAVPADYQMQLITLSDGRLVSGIIRERGPKAIVVQTETQSLTIAQEDIDQVKPSGQSMMPQRQLDNLTREQIRDLFGYLATKSQVER
jgi:putative heme-binding domain-containing protein